MASHPYDPGATSPIKAKRSKSENAATLGRDRSTSYREFRRNRGGRGYRPQLAQRKADERHLACRREPKMNDPDFKGYATRLLKKCWSPDQIAGRARKEFPREASHQTIYNWLAAEASELLIHLRRGRRRSQPETRGRIANWVGIEGRPKAVDAKLRYGDWEGDTLVNPWRRSGLVTIVERKSQYLRVRKTPSRKSPATMLTACRGLRDLPAGLLRTMTLDNGKEFAHHQVLTDQLGLGVYFAMPYASWQRGLNENTNGLLRPPQRNRFRTDQSPPGGLRRKTTQRTSPEKSRLPNSQQSLHQEARCNRVSGYLTMLASRRPHSLLTGVWTQAKHENSSSLTLGRRHGSINCQFGPLQRA